MLGTPPRASSAMAIRLECRRLVAIRAALVEPLDWGPITPNRRRQWASIVRRLYARDLSRYPEAKRLTLLLAFLTVRAEEATDAIVEMFDQLIGRVFDRTDDKLTEAKAERADAQADSARLFRAVAEILLDASILAASVRDEVFRRVPKDQLGELVEKTRMLEEGEVVSFFALLKDRFPYVRAFVPDILNTLRFTSGRSDNELLRAIETLRAMGDEQRRKVPATASMAFVPRRWMKAVGSPNGLDRRAWELCLLSEMRAALQAGDLTVAGSRRYTPWDTDLHSPAAWRERRASWFAERGLPPDGAAYVADATEELNALTLEVAGRLTTNPATRIDDGKLAVDAPDRFEVPPAVDSAQQALTKLRERRHHALARVNESHSGCTNCLLTPPYLHPHLVPAYTSLPCKRRPQPSAGKGIGGRRRDASFVQSTSAISAGKRLAKLTP